MDQNCFKAQNTVTGGAISTSYFSQVRVGMLLYCLGMLSCFSHVQLFAALWTVAHQAPLSMGFARQKYCSGLPFPSPRDLPDPGIEPVSPALAGGFFTTEPLKKPVYVYVC